MLLESAFALSGPVADKIQYFFHLIFNSALQLIYGISSDLQKLLEYFNDGTAIVVFFKNTFASRALVFRNKLVFYLKIYILPLAISAVKLVASSFE